jgi:hypothetical protein
MSFFSPRTDFVCDEVERFEVMLHLDHSDILAILIIVPDCPSIRPNHVSYCGFFPDLWLALKGGSDNFGIVTAFDLITIELLLGQCCWLPYRHRCSVVFRFRSIVRSTKVRPLCCFDTELWLICRNAIMGHVEQDGVN